MGKRDVNDREIRELFSGARRADREATPDFVTMRAAARESVRRSRPSRAVRFAFMTGVGAVAIGAVAVWMAARSPEAILPEAPPAVWDTEPARPAREAVSEEENPEEEKLQRPERSDDTDRLRSPGYAPPTRKKLKRKPAEVTAPAGTAPALPRPSPPMATPAPPPPPPPPAKQPARVTEDIREQARVVAQREVVDLEKAEASARLSERRLASLPTPGRFYQNVLTLAPGVQSGDGDGYTNVHGSRSRDFKAVVGGVSNAEPLTGDGEAGPGFNTEGYSPITENEFLSTVENPLSTFSIDVDTGSYANVRRFLNQGQLPPRDAVRIEELINYFHYDYPAPDGDAPFSVNVEVAECPWSPDHRLARIGLKGRQVSRADFAGSNLVFLIDVSGSMQPANKLPLLKSALSLLVDQLDGRDQVAIVVYAGAAGVVLPSTSGHGKGEIQNALDRLRSGGSTNGGQGIRLAYDIARENFIPGGVNRVILATDGDFNVGITDKAALLKAIQRDADNGIFLTTLGFGMGNYKDDMLETLADKGNGNYAYIDSLREARKVLVEQIGGTLVTIAKDVKIQVEFNPVHVVGYRLIGYENRMLRKEDFNDDRKDAGEIGAGHTVTALYEIVPAGEKVPTSSVDPLKYQQAVAPSEAAGSGEMLTLKLRYKEPEARKSRLLSFPVVDGGRSLAAASEDFKFASAVAGFGMILRQSQFAGEDMLDRVGSLAREGAGPDEGGYRAEFRQLVGTALPLLEQRSTD